MKPLVISYYTDALYESLARRLGESCSRYGLEHDIRKRGCRGEWIRNCAQKPTHIMEMLEEHDRDVLWVDADAEFVGEPIGLDVECDFGFFITTWQRYMSGTLLIRNTEPTRRLVQDWIGQQRKKPDAMDEETMRDVVVGREELRTVQLDPGYLYVFDIWTFEYPDVKPIVLHKMASRLFIEKYRSLKPDRTIAHLRSRSGGVHPDVKGAVRELRS